jgi:uncharacterized protein YukE
MSVIDKVAGLPGGQTLAALAAQVQGSQEAIHDLANRWSGVASGTLESTTAVDKAASGVSQAWRGSSNDAFAEVMSQFSRAGGATQQSLSAAAATLTQTGFAVEQVQKDVHTICENLLIQVSQVRAVNPGAATADVSTQISSLISEATHMVRAVTTTFENVLNQAGTALSAELAGLSRGFSSLRKPGDAPTQTTRWTSRSDTRRDTPAPRDGTVVPGGFDIKETTRPVAETTQPVADTTVHTAPGDVSGAPQQVDAWIRQAIQILEASGVPASQLNAQHIWQIIEHESSGNPSAVNTWDYNAVAGTPSIGLMQTIQPTFNAYALPGHGEITNPIDNIIAGTRYALGRYGSLDNVPGIDALRRGQPYVGY